MTSGSRTTLAAPRARTCRGGAVARLDFGSVHDEAAVDAQRLSRHVARLARDEKADHVGDVLRALHAPEWDGARALAGELVRRHPHELALIARDGGPHVGLHEARANAVHAD